MSPADPEPFDVATVHRMVSKWRARLFGTGRWAWPMKPALLIQFTLTATSSNRDGQAHRFAGGSGIERFESRGG